MDCFDDDFAPLQSSEPVPASAPVVPAVPADDDDAPLFLGDDDIEVEKRLNVEVGDSLVNNPTRSSPNDDHSSASSSEFSSHHRHEVKEDPEVIKQWKEAQVLKLEAKDREEEKAKLVLKQQAKKELEDWYKQHSEQMAKLQAAHRAASETTEREIAMTGIQNPITPGTEWERIAKLCDFNPKSAKNTKDVSRMRSVILQLKQGGNPPTSISVASHGV